MVVPSIWQKWQADQFPALAAFGGDGLAAVSPSVFPATPIPSGALDRDFTAVNVNTGAQATPLGWNAQTGQLALGGLQTLGNLLAAFGSLGLAKKQFRFTKDVTRTNLANQAKSYNTALEDRITSRAAVQGMSPEMAKAYLDRNKLSGTIGN